MSYKTIKKMLQWNTIINLKDLKIIIISKNKDGTSILAWILNFLFIFVEDVDTEIRLPS